MNKVTIANREIAYQPLSTLHLGQIGRAKTDQVYMRVHDVNNAALLGINLVLGLAKYDDIKVMVVDLPVTIEYHSTNTDGETK